MKFLIQPVLQNSYSYPGIDTNKKYVLSPMNSGLVAAVRSGAIVVEQRTWTEDPAQQWRFEKVSGTNYYKIISVASGKVMDVTGGVGATGDGVGIQVYGYGGSNNQQFELIYLGASRFRIQARHSGKVLDVYGNQSSEGTQIIQYTWHGGNNQQWRVSEILDISSAPTYKSKVIVYSDANYGGTGTEIGLGNYDMNDIGLPNDCISSLKVPQGLRVTLFRDAGFRGTKKQFTADTTYVGDDFNDQTSSILVELVASVYQHGDYQGNVQHLGIGSYNLADLTIGGDQISSVKVPPGMQVVLYEHPDFKGNSKVVTTDVPVLTGFNDVVSSIQVKMVGVVIPDDAVGFGDQIILKSYQNKYLTASATNLSNTSTSTPDSAKLTIYRAGSTVNGTWLCFGDVIALKTSSGKYLSAQSNGTLLADRTAVGEWEKFVVMRSGETESRTFVAKDDVITLRSVAHGKYVCAQDSGTVSADRTAIGGWEKFTIAEMVDAPEDPALCGAQACGAQACAVDASGLAACGADLCGAQAMGVFACGADICAAALCGAQAAALQVCGAAAAAVAVCGLDVSGMALCGAEGAGVTACGGNVCGAAMCAAAGCGADACGGAACGVAACGAAGCGAAACGAAACPIDACGAAGCGADGCAVAVGIPCPIEACGANVCAIDLCPADLCAADACAIDLIPIIPGI